MNYCLPEACQNTFVLFDCLSTPQLSSQMIEKAHQILLETKRDDALLLTEAKQEGKSLLLKMVVLGADGAFGEFCGNGARATASYLFAHYPTYQKFFLTTPWGQHLLAQEGEGLYSVTLPFPSFSLNPKFIRDLPKGFHFVEMIEPHLILEGKKEDEELFELGRMLNQDKERFPLGINVNAYEVVDGETLFVKTYERGVQRLTKSCGTGSASCAAFHQKKGTCKVSTPGGALQFLLKERELVMTGPASLATPLFT